MRPFNIKPDDELEILRRMLEFVSSRENPWDPTQEPKFVTRTSSDEDIDTEGIAGQFDDSAYRHRESLVATTLAVCASLSGTRGVKTWNQGLYFLRVALEERLEVKCRCYKPHQESLTRHEPLSPVDKDTFHGPEFWQAPQVIAYALVQVAWEWYDSCRRVWACEAAKQFLRGDWPW